MTVLHVDVDGETDMMSVKNKVESVEAVTVDVISLREQALGAGL
jgi:hypothetical protein